MCMGSPGLWPGFFSFGITFFCAYVSYRERKLFKVAVGFKQWGEVD